MSVPRCPAEARGIPVARARDAPSGAHAVQPCSRSERQQPTTGTSPTSADRPRLTVRPITGIVDTWRPVGSPARVPGGDDAAGARRASRPARLRPARAHAGPRTVRDPRPPAALRRRRTPARTVRWSPPRPHPGAAHVLTHPRQRRPARHTLPELAAHIAADEAVAFDTLPDRDLVSGLMDRVVSLLFPDGRAGRGPRPRSPTSSTRCTRRSCPSSARSRAPLPTPRT